MAPSRFQLGLSTVHAVVATAWGLVYLPRFLNAAPEMQYECDTDLFEPVKAMTSAFIAFLCSDLAIAWYGKQTCLATTLHSKHRGSLGTRVHQ